MRLPLLLIISLFSILEINAQTNTKLNNDIDSYISKVQEQYNLPGVALAVIKNGKIIHKRYYGVANVEYSVLVNENTLFPLFSTTKVFSVITIHQLIEQKKMSLENTISDFLDDLPEDWKNVKIKHLLTHSSGLPDIVAYETDRDEEVAKSKVYKDSIKFSSGNEFDYNQTNFWVLSRILKKIVGKTLSEYIIETQFPSSKNLVVFEGNNLKVIQNLSYGYMKRENDNYFLKRNWNFPEYMYGTAGLNLTLNSFIDWNKKFDEGIFISEVTKKQLLTPFDYKKQRYFCYGLDLIKVNEQTSYGFSGGVATAFRKFPDKNLTIILLANGMLIPTEKLNGINEVVNNIAIMVN
ncbi:serine hydrolase domain-containing protein [Flavobacterium sp.]|uniref:serine hydrolase domain-containing protein n=1 Tax=Flavobacterium sp. TaxID=239 RepID=UPI00286E1206|nr:serine hydrolase domain-containing protein [Flavobacterium sp.]